MSDDTTSPAAPEAPDAPEARQPYARPRLTVHGPLDPVTQIQGGSILPDEFDANPG